MFLTSCKEYLKKCWGKITNDLKYYLNCSSKQGTIKTLFCSMSNDEGSYLTTSLNIIQTKLNIGSSLAWVKEDRNTEH